MEDDDDGPYTPTYTRLPDRSTRSVSSGVVKLRLRVWEFPVHHDILYDGSLMYRDAVDSTGGTPLEVLEIPTEFSPWDVDFFLCLLYNVPWEVHRDFLPNDQLKFLKFINPSPNVLLAADAVLRTHGFFYECEQFTPGVHDVLHLLLLLDQDFRTTLPQTHQSAKTRMQSMALYHGREFFSIFASRDLLKQLHPETVIDLWHVTMWSYVDLETAYAQKCRWEQPSTSGALTAPDLRSRFEEMGETTYTASRPNKLYNAWSSMPLRYTIAEFEFSLTIDDPESVESRMTFCLKKYVGSRVVENPTLEVVYDKSKLAVWVCGECDAESGKVKGRVCPAYLKGRLQIPSSVEEDEVQTLKDWSHCVTLYTPMESGVMYFQGQLRIIRH